MNDEGRAFPALGMLYEILAIPFNFFFGFLVGLLAPVAAIAAMVAGVRFLTGKMPFLSLSQDEERRHVSLDLVPQEEVSTRFAAEKQKVLDELTILQDEIKSLIEEAKAQQAEEAEA
jgi:hypothetical protein